LLVTSQVLREKTKHKKRRGKTPKTEVEAELGVSDKEQNHSRKLGACHKFCQRRRKKKQAEKGTTAWVAKRGGPRKGGIPDRDQRLGGGSATDWGKENRTDATVQPDTARWHS